MAELAEIGPDTAGGKEGIDLLKKAEENPDSLASREPAALYGLIAFLAALVVLLLGLFVGAGLSFLVLVVMLAQLFFTKKAVFSPKSAIKLLRA